jgi:hypothetical protein
MFVAQFIGIKKRERMTATYGSFALIFLQFGLALIKFVCLIWFGPVCLID